MVTTSATSELVAAERIVDRPLSPAHLRRPAVVAIVLALLLVVGLALRYAHQETAGSPDRALDSYIRIRLQGEQGVTGALVSFVCPPGSVFVLAAVTGLGALARRWSGVILTLGGTLIAVMITAVDLTVPAVPPGQFRT
jgi:hypothetical protein